MLTAAPGCTSRANLESHHIRYRSGGGGHEETNQVCLCRFHHQRGAHAGQLRVFGQAPDDLTWQLGRPDLAITYRNGLRI